MAAVATPRVDVRGVASDEELRLANDLMARSHQPAYDKSIAWLESFGATYPGFEREHTRLAFIDGVMAGALRLTTETIRLGEARLKMGGLGWVTTASDHRHRGVASALIEDTTRFMLSRGYHVSMLFGIPNFYHRFGYATTLADYAVVLDAGEAQGAGPNRFRVRPVKPGDIPAMHRLHQSNNRETACSIVRSRAHYTNRWNQFRQCVVLTDAQGKVLAYAYAVDEDGELHVKEAAIESAGVAPDLLSCCASRARAQLLPAVRFSLPPEHPMGRYLTQFESRHEMKLCRQSGGMMTLVDLGEALEMLIPEWERLLRDSAAVEGHHELTLLSAGKSFRLRSHHGAIEIAEATGRNKVHVPPETLMQLVAGYAGVEEVLDAYRRLVSADARILLHALFPKRNPYVHLLDRF